MQVRITRPVVISTPAGIRHLAPGLKVTVTEDEAGQILRQKAGTRIDVERETESKPASPKKKSTVGP